MIRTRAFLILPLFLLIGCNNSSHISSDPQIYNPNGFAISRWFESITPDAQPIIQVYNQHNEPVANAQVLIGHRIGSPFPENFLKTDNKGQVVVPDWTTKAAVTVDAKGYIRQTVLNQKPGLLQIKLNAISIHPRPTLKGQVTQLPVVNSDKHVDFGLVIPAFNKSDLINFDLDSIISPFNDKFSVAGMNVELPSNISLPTQKESYFIPVTLSKPEYRIITPNYGPRTFFALSGRFPFKTVVGEFQDGKPFYDVLNHFNFTSGSLRDLNVNQPLSVLNIPGTEIIYDSQLNIKGSAVNDNEVLLSIAMSDMAHKLIPTDVKRSFPEQETKLKSIKGSLSYIVSLLTTKSNLEGLNLDSEENRSISVLPYLPNSKNKTLPLITAPQLTESNNSYFISIPEVSSYEGINPIAVSLTISKIVDKAENGQTISFVDKEWEILGLTQTQWPKNISLPAWPLVATENQRKIELNLIGSSTDTEATLGQDLLNKTTHVTHSALKF